MAANFDDGYLRHNLDSAQEKEEHAPQIERGSWGRKKREKEKKEGKE